MKIIKRNNYLSQEQYEAFIDIWANREILSPAFIELLKTNPELEKLFVPDNEKLIITHNRTSFKKILSSVGQTYEDTQIKAFKYYLKDKVYKPVYNSKPYLKDIVKRYLKSATNNCIFDDKLKKQIETILDLV